MIGFVATAFALGGIPRVYKVPSVSMEPTIASGSRIFAVLGRTDVKRWDVIVFKHPSGKDYVKRVVGLPGETLALSKEGVVVDGKLVARPSNVPWGDPQFESRIVLAPDEFFVIGDNAGNSQDSRHFGGVPLARVRGIVVGL